MKPQKNRAQPALLTPPLTEVAICTGDDTVTTKDLKHHALHEEKLRTQRQLSTRTLYNNRGYLTGILLLRR
jgi:hypothetical protein